MGKILEKPNPYKATAGAELDCVLSKAFFADEACDLVRSFSQDAGAAEVLKKKLERRYKASVITGRSRGKYFFARLDTDPSTCTEALGETYALAIARLALVLAS